MAEASCLGKPSIAANTPEAPEYCNNGDSAVLFEMNNKIDFLKKIEYFINYKKNIDLKAQSGISIVKELFDTERNTKLLNEVYLELQCINK